MENYRLSGAEALARQIEKEYSVRSRTDYHMPPLNLYGRDGRPVGLIESGDAVIFCCRRGERETELTDAFTDPAFSAFDRDDLWFSDFVPLTMYSEKYTYLPVAFAPEKVRDTLAQTVSAAGRTQLHLAESEKYAHVTFFFNGGEQRPCPGEEDVCVPSPRGIPFDQVPQLSLPAVADRLREGVDRGIDLIVVNFANGDVIGHTTSDVAKLKAAQAVDRYLSESVRYAREHGFHVLITADHGNIETLRGADGQPHVAHTSNPVALFAPGAHRLATNGALCDVAPTVLSAMGLPRPAAMTGKAMFAFERPSKTLLIILDGWGLGSGDGNDTLHLAETPFWDHLLQYEPFAALGASGPDVGLQPGKPGNSEAGHINLGSGRVILQDDVRLERAMADGSFRQNGPILKAIRTCKDKGTALHLLALLSQKSSHGSVDYPLEILRMARQEGLERVFVHIILDGRSTQQGSAPALLKDFGRQLEQIGAGIVVSGVGRGLALDRDKNWDCIKTVYDSLVSGLGTAYREA